ncbi:MAG: hypothetical protein KJ069_16205 [Anaerolineae bacterium]|nr:hypothetical protein [Anaerolineae bacterium]
MQSNWIPTNEYYHRLLAEPDADKRQQLYLELFVNPWQQMMSMMANAESDSLAGARAWGWLLPDQVEQTAVLLAKMEAAHAWEMGCDALETALARFAPYAAQIPFETVSGWLLLADAARSNPLERGYTGATHWMQPQFLGQFWEPNEYNLLRLGGLIAHEMHHLIRLRAFPWDMQHTSVADYIIIEGTAEAFAASLFGEDKVGYYVTDFNEAELETARRLVGEGLNATGFNLIRSYIFGDALAERSGFAPLGGMPTYGGYAIGYRVVQAFLERSGCSIEETTFLPAVEIVQGSGYFD